MDMLKNLSGSQNEGKVSTESSQAMPPSTGNSSGGGLMDKLHGIAGGGKSSEKNEDAIDKGVDWVQENVLKQGPQDNESAIEQAKDEQISDFVRSQYKGMTGKDVPIADK
ncbi:hypothetical protein B0H66DRAFT_498938 [Apodospora peruviana]|uniref:DNA damage-responsive protein 48 n=1 Tax=Apodospora peruviana TaxID=516989 RepID=A0AAE0HZQ3_9PEZI|nr:hypothetical protein B0H66DRAFT_498938 [Apodospora peruviana]